METIALSKKEIDSLLVFNKGGFEGKILLYDNETVIKQFESYLGDYTDIEAKKYKLERLKSRKVGKVLVEPKALVSVEGNFCGYAMAKVSNAMHLNSIRDYNRLLEVYSKLFHNLEYLHQKNIVVGDLKPSNILVDYKYQTKFIDVDSMGIDEYEIDHPEYRSTIAKMLPNYIRKYEVNSKENIDNYLLLVCFINSLSKQKLSLPAKLFSSDLSIETKKLLFSVLKSDSWNMSENIGEILEKEKIKTITLA